jgi:hypothetical protein
VTDFNRDDRVLDVQWHCGYGTVQRVEPNGGLLVLFDGHPGVQVCSPNHVERVEAVVAR